MIKKFLLVMASVLMMGLLPSYSAEAGTIYESPHVTVTADGEAWTACMGQKHNYRYPDGYSFSTGIASTLRALQTGEHYYTYERSGMIPVGRWEVVHEAAYCIHNFYPDSLDSFHGIPYGRNTCGGEYTQGWFAYCADCGEEVANLLMYLCEDAARSISYIPTGMEYFYLCPHCNNLEQGKLIEIHDCRKISANRYKVVYDNNERTVGALVSGYMTDSFHMYNNATVYEGETAIPNTRLSKVGYRLNGYEFIGWNTKADGSGTWYEDEAEILNLTSYNFQTDEVNGTVTLYAQWKRSDSTLQIDPAGGIYGGNAGITTLTKPYLSSYNLDAAALIPPEGATLHFETNGGEAVGDITASLHFAEWMQGNPFKGRLVGDTYYFLASSGNVDRLTARYVQDTVTLPGTTKGNYSFGGWYYDAYCTLPAGGEGDILTVSRDTTLYAQWVNLELTSTENYRDNGGKGAVDLAWNQSEAADNAYKVYRYEEVYDNSGAGPSDNTADWTQMGVAADSENNVLEVSKDFAFSGTGEAYAIPYTGLYILTAAGAQGGNQNSGTYTGGLGGKISGSFWLREGDVLTVDVGGQNGYGSGGLGTGYGNGGGRTVITSKEQGALLIAGGGGGATEKGNGGGGGSSVSLRADGQGAGEDGTAGGGAGHVGGTAGELIVHHHTDECYYIEHLDYTLFDESGGNAWMNRYWNEGSMYSVFGGASYLHSISNCSMSSHSGALEDADYFSHLMAVGAYGGKTKPSWAGTYIPVKGNTGVNIGIRIYDWGNNTAFDTTGSYIRVYNQNNECIYDHAIIPQTTQRYDTTSDEDGIHYTPLTVETDAGGIAGIHRDYKQADTWTDWDGNFHENCYTDTISGTLSVALPEGTTEIYIEVYSKVTMSGGAYTNHSTSVTGVWFTGGINKKVICGYTEGQVISSKPGYGGSSYVNTESCSYYEETAGSRQGDGYAALKSIDVGYLEEMSMDGVAAPDKEAPENVAQSSVEIEPAEGDTTGSRIRISWEEPADKGTGYYFMVESHSTRTGAKLCRSNITFHTLKTGVKGYRYITDRMENTTVTETNSIYTDNAELQMTLTNQIQYLHIAAVDGAGNMSGTTTVKIGSLTQPAMDICWPVFTEQIMVSEGEGIYPAEDADTYYVRCDKRTPVELSFGSYITGAATDNYQITHTNFKSEMQGGIVSQNIIETPMYELTNGDIITSGSGLGVLAEGASVLLPYQLQTIRSNRNRKLQVTARFYVETEIDGRVMKVTPGAVVETEKYTVYSEETLDLLNGIVLIGDATPPTISGTDGLSEEMVIDKNAGEIKLTFGAEDFGSGVADFAVQVYSEEHGGSKTYTPDEDGTVTLNLTEDISLYAGDFSITILATDNVGNRREEKYHVTEFALETEVERILSPHAPIFARSESGILTIEAWGYVERLEVEFPAFLSVYNKTIIYDVPKYRQTGQIQFLVPQGVETDGTYEVIIKAYKGENELENVEVITVEGNVLDELRTRLR